MEDGRPARPAAQKGNALAKAKTKTTTTATASIAAKPDWQMPGILAEPVEEYLYSMLPPRDEVLAEMEAEAAKRKIPIVGPAVGRILHQLALMIWCENSFRDGLGHWLFDDLVGTRRRPRWPCVLHRRRSQERRSSARIFREGGSRVTNQHRDWRRSGTSLRTQTGIRHYFQRRR